MRVFPSLLIFAAATGLRAQQGEMGELLTARHGANGTWNLYMPSSEGLTWSKAQAFAEGKIDPAGGTGKKGHLATISSGAENTFVYHYLGSRIVWIGLTDDAKFPGAKKAKGLQDQGWAWVTGEPVTWTNWQSSEPSNNDITDGKDDDGVTIENGGFWNNRPNGAAGKGIAYRFMIEWDVQSPKPVAGARVIGAILPPKWPAPDPRPVEDPEKPWVCANTAEQPEEPGLADLAKSISKDWDGTNYFRMSDLNFRMGMTSHRNAFGWIFGSWNEFPANVMNNFGMLARARLRIPKAGTYTFDVHADDGFALRLGTHKWKAVQGSGGIDPCDETTLFGMLLSSDTDVRGVIELPAGEVPIEVFYINGAAEGCLQITTAEGEHLREGSTDRWRNLGYKPAANVPWPGVSAEGWKVTIPIPGENCKETAENALLDTIARVEDPAAKVTTGCDVIHFHDPECTRRTRFPGAVPFPNDPPGPQDDRVVMAEATLVIPADGTYNIGIGGDDLCALATSGQKWSRVVRDAGRGYARIDGDSISVRRSEKNVSHEIIGEIKLAKGSYPIRGVSWDRNGTSAMNIFAAPVGWPGRLLTKNKAGIEADIPGLEVLPFKP
ncbi:MAG TPA: lectin-like protein [Verrucomicrobiales bacterium]|nr:lectin-like protein [Verrucomicrobiales bacterium]